MGKDYYSPLNESYGNKYDDSVRIDLLKMLKEAPERVLEIGCSWGGTGGFLKRQFTHLYYVGVELNEEAAARARTRLDRVIVADIEKTELGQLGLEKDCFDLVIFGDVLEHLYDPWKVLYRIRPYVKDGGRVLASIPNVQNMKLLANLLEGVWPYQVAGLLDATHIRFFTLKEIHRLFIGTGYEIAQCSVVTDTPMDPKEFPRDIVIGKLVLKQLSYDDALPFYAFQYLVMARKLADKTDDINAPPACNPTAVG